MTIQWADDFTRYGLGSDSAIKMRDGLPYNNWISQCIADPDPVAAAAGSRAIYIDDGLNNNPLVENRIALPNPTAGTVGFAARYWFTSFGSGSGRQVLVNWVTVGLSRLASVQVDTNGALRIVDGAGNDIATTGAPVISTNSWNHIESTYNGTTGGMEVRLNGSAILTGTSPQTGTIAFAHPNRRSGTSLGSSLILKDMVIWDGSGATNNNFFGTVSCRRIVPDSDVTLGGWLPSGGTTGYDLLADKRPANVFTATGNLDPDGTENIRIDNTYYRPTVGSVDAGAPAGTSANPWLFALGVDAAASIANFFNAINGTGTPGTTYSTALTPHPTVTAKGFSPTQLIITSNDGATNTYVCTETMANASWASGTMKVVGPQDLSYLSADDTPPAAMEFGFENLPPDITSVRGLVVVGRMRKVDGGDGNVQMSLISNGDAFDGVDRPLTTTMTYYFDVSQLDPDTGLPWSPFAVDNMTGRVNRTI